MTKRHAYLLPPVDVSPEQIARALFTPRKQSDQVKKENDKVRLLNKNRSDKKRKR